ncbi:hypothetical protein [Patulibacter americanus]|uniref:hypothetical protein n=1 Tax=Patulibacter americanus TaxID=588672 RepID=UPI0003B59387|nr:hypothetical protein [Patulibacter americanus]
MTVDVAAPRAAVAERAEAESMFRVNAGVTAAVRGRLGTAALRLRGGVAVGVREDPTGYWNKALGFGFDEPVTHELLDELVAFYAAQGTGATLQLAPSVLPEDWDELAEAYGITHDTTWIKLAGPVDAAPPARTELCVGTVYECQLSEWASVLLRGFGMPEDPLVAMLRSGIRQPGFVPVAAWDGSEMVAAAGLLLDGPAAHFFGAATLPEHHGRGAQGALQAFRAQKAREAGCRWLVAETGKPAPGAPRTSLDNLLRTGLVPLYERENWTLPTP